MNRSLSGKADDFFSAKQIIRIAAISVGYLLLSRFLIGYKTEQVYLVFFFIACYFASNTSRKFIIGFSIFIVFWIIFDYMKAYPNYLFRQVHIKSLYDAEKSIFGIAGPDGILTPNEYWQQHGSVFLDVITGLFYLCWVPVPLAFATYLFFKSRIAFLQFSLTFLFVNLIGFAIYYIYPAAPPWYIQQHGFHFLPGIPGNTAGLKRFDNFFGVGIFQSLYGKSSNVFAAMPSLHASYMVIVLYYGVKNRLRWINILFAAIMSGIWFSGVYNSHHYILDMIAGVLCAIVGIALFQWMVTKNNIIRNGVQKFADIIT